MKVTHPNVCRVHDLCTHGAGTLFLTMELLDGETLAERLRRGRMATLEALPIVTQMAAALDAAHQAGVVHRDFKTSNVMLASGGRRAVVTDFGIAHQFAYASAAGDVHDLTPAGLFVGTPAYLAPEQVEAGPITPAVDIYALGVVMYEMVTGELPFAGETPLAVAAKRLREDPTPARQHLPGLDPRWESTIMRCLRREPAERFTEAAEAVAALTAAHAPAKPKRSLVSRRPVLVSIAGLLTALGLGEWFWLSRRGATIDSLAILPFADATSDSSLGFLKDGIVEGLINNVAQLPQLTVIARSSTLRYKPDDDPQAAGRKLNVRAVLTGKISRGGEEVRVAVELVDVRDNRHLWGKTYRRTMATMANMETDIAREISDELRPRLTSTSKQLLTRGHTENSEAYLEYVRGRYYWNQRTQDGYSKGIEHLRRAIELDPAYALAYAGLADCYMFQDAPPKEAFGRAMAAARRALELDNRLAMAHASVGYIDFLYEWNWAESESELRQAIELNPNYATAHSMYARYLVAMGRSEEALRQAVRASELDPLSPGISTGVGLTYFLSRRFDQAIDQYKKTLAMEPKFWLANLSLAIAYNQKGRYSDAISVLQAKADAGDEEALLHLGYAHALAGHDERARKILALLTDRAHEKRVSSYHLSYLYTGLGDKDRAIARLGKACDERAPSVAFLRVQPELDPLRSDPRFDALLQRAGLKR